MVGASGFFSWKRQDAAVVGAASITPNSAACFLATGMAATVTSALFCTWNSIMLVDVHAVDVVAAEDRHHVRIGLLHQVDVLVDGVGRALVPGFAGERICAGTGMMN